jgi:hypothetical protein
MTSPEPPTVLGREAGGALTLVPMWLPKVEDQALRPPCVSPQLNQKA